MKFPWVFTAAFLAFTPFLRAQLIVVEPDDYPNLTVLNHIVPQVSLITVASNNLPHPPVGFNVSARTDTIPFAPPTGTNVFAHATVPFWYTDRRLRMDFDGLVSTIHIEFQGGNGITPEVGRLEAYGLDGTLLQTFLTAPLLGGESQTMSIDRNIADIRWAVAYTDVGQSSFGDLDFLRFSMPVPIPEPSTWALLAVGVAAVMIVARKTFPKSLVARRHWAVVPPSRLGSTLKGVLPKTVAGMLACSKAAEHSRTPRR